MTRFSEYALVCSVPTVREKVLSGGKDYLSTHCFFRAYYEMMKVRIPAAWLRAQQVHGVLLQMSGQQPLVEEWACSDPEWVQEQRPHLEVHLPGQQMEWQQAGQMKTSRLRRQQGAA